MTTHFAELRRILIPAVLLAATAVLLPGCAHSPSNSSSSSNLTGPEKDKEYTALVTAAEDNIPAGADLPAAGRGICEGLRLGNSIDTVEQVIEKDGRNSQNYAKALLGPAPGVYCPTYSAQMSVWIATH